MFEVLGVAVTLGFAFRVLLQRCVFVTVLSCDFGGCECVQTCRDHSTRLAWCTFCRRPKHEHD